MNAISVQQNQTQKHARYIVPKSERIAVKAGDIIGWVSQFLFFADGYDRVYQANAEEFSLADNNEYPFENMPYSRKYAINATVEPIEGILLFKSAYL